jgi:hypothetical protein
VEELKWKINCAIVSKSINRPTKCVCTMTMWYPGVPFKLKSKIHKVIKKTNRNSYQPRLIWRLINLGPLSCQSKSKQSGINFVQRPTGPNLAHVSIN